MDLLAGRPGLARDEMCGRGRTHSGPRSSRVAWCANQHKRLAPPPFVTPASDPLWVLDPLVKMMPPAQRAAMFGRGVGDRDGKRVLVGSPSGPGRAQGIARVISGPESSRDSTRAISWWRRRRHRSGRRCSGSPPRPSRKSAARSRMPRSSRVSLASPWSTGVGNVVDLRWIVS